MSSESYSIVIPIELKDRLTEEFNRLSTAVKGREAEVRQALTSLKTVGSDTLDTIRTKVEGLGKANVDLKNLENLKKKLTEVAGSGHEAGGGIEHGGDALHGLSEKFEIVNGKLKTFTNFAHLAGAAVLEIAGAEFLKESIERVAEYGESIEKAGLKTGLTTDAIQEMNYVAKLNGTSIDALIPSFKNLAKNVETAAGGNKVFSKIFQDLGVDIDSVKRGTISLDQVNTQVIGRLAGMTDETKRLAEATKIYGRGALELLPIIAQGAERFQKQREEAHEFGVVLSEDAIAKASELKENFERLNAVMEAAKFKVLTPLLEGASESVTALIATMTGLEGVFSTSDVEVEKFGGRLSVFQSIVAGTVETLLLFGIGLKTSYETIATAGQLIGTLGAQAILPLREAFEALEATMVLVAHVAGEVFEALAHPSQAKEAIKEVEGYLVGYGQKMKEIVNVTQSVSGDIWKEFGKNAADNLESTQVAIEAATKSVQALRSNLSGPAPEKKNRAPTGDDATESADPALFKKLQEQLIQIKEDAAKASAAANLDGLQKEQADECASYAAKLAKYHQFNDLRGTEAKAYYQGTKALLEAHNDTLLTIQEKYDAKTLAEHEKTRHEADNLAGKERVREAEDLIKAVKDKLKLQEEYAKVVSINNIYSLF